MFNVKKIILMKKHQLLIMASTFMSGIILGISSLLLFAFTSTGTSAPSTLSATKITVKEANAFFRNYLDKAAPSSQVLRGFALNKEQLSALNSLSNENPNLAGFRIYLGYDTAKATSVGILVGVDANGKDATNSIFRSTAVSSGPCPTICDVSSDIMAN